MREVFEGAVSQVAMYILITPSNENGTVLSLLPGSLDTFIIRKLCGSEEYSRTTLASIHPHTKDCKAVPVLFIFRYSTLKHLFIVPSHKQQQRWWLTTKGATWASNKMRFVWEFKTRVRISRVSKNNWLVTSVLWKAPTSRILRKISYYVTRHSSAYNGRALRMRIMGISTTKHPFRID